MQNLCILLKFSSRQDITELSEMKLHMHIQAHTHTQKPSIAEFTLYI